MKTALQKLLDEFSALPHMPISRSLMIHLIHKQMPQEKQQIIDAANQIEIIGKDHLLPGEEYYEKKYNNNELI